eukprot:TRINITY_DN8602_c0_g1_i1.p1 TRINITY_DN8602_c0_g1~~TRINITY_DN8602_c0_g1_i1.p1  ORF type:complete len:668 (-),score=166.90 TRINITY_DN8602_c0_g1_i1:32-2035(-)
MFKKPFKVQSQTLLRSSEKKRFRSRLLEVFPKLTEETLSVLIDPKDDITCQRVVASSGIHLIYTVLSEPLFIDAEQKGDLFPTLYAIWRAPSIVDSVTIHVPVFKYIQSGADLMLPGIRLPPGGIAELGPLKIGERRAIVLSNHPAAVAVGSLLVGNDHIRKNGMKGKGIRVVHFFKDYVWKSGSKTIPHAEADAVESASEDDGESDVSSEEDLPPAGELAEAAFVAQEKAQKTTVLPRDEAEVPEEWDDGIENDPHLVEAIERLEKSKLENLAKEKTKALQKQTAIADEKVDDGSDSDEQDGHESDGGDSDSSDEDDTPAGPSRKNKVADEDDANPATSQLPNTPTISPAEMDALLERCLLQAIKTMVKDKELPLLVSIFYSNYMLASRPTDSYVDIKKSTYKKLSQFLKAIEKRGILKVKDVRGVQQITSINRSHPEVVQFKEDKQLASKIIESAAASTSSPSDAAEFVIRELYQPPQQIVKMFPSQSSKAMYTASEIREVFETYARREELILPLDPHKMRLDPRLAQLFKLEGTEILAVDHFAKLFQGRMNVVYELRRGDEDPVYSKGALPTIQLIAENRTGKKHVTRIIGLEQFLLNPEQLAQEFRTQFASSTSVSPLPGKGAGMEVLVQGNIIKELTTEFTKKYKIPKSSIVSTDKTKGKGK